MRHHFFAGLVLALSGILLAGTGCEPPGLGDPCILASEYDDGFAGFDVNEIQIEDRSSQCRTGICLGNHYRGRTSCPTGRDCTVPGTSDPVQVQVPPECPDRPAEAAVYCSCRCANAEGRTDDGATYCDCSEGYACAALVPDIGGPDQGLTGSYCIKAGTEYDPAASCQ